MFAWFLRLSTWVYISSVLCIACSESKDDILTRLSQTTYQNASNRPVLIKTQQEITQIISQTNAKNSVLIAPSNRSRIIKTSLDGNTLAWLQKQKLFYIRGGKKDSLSIKVRAKIIDFHLSWSGHYAVIVVKKIKKKNSLQSICQPHIISLITEQNQKIETYKVPEIDCDHNSVVSDDGHYLFYIAKNKLQRLPLPSLKKKKTLEDKVQTNNKQAFFPSSVFLPKYKKIKNRFILYQVNSADLLIFFGNAGYYRLYYYRDSQQQGIKAHPLIFSSPQLYYYSHNQWLNQTTIEQKDGQSQKILKDHQKFHQADAFAYSGGAGKHKLHPLYFGKKIKVGQGFVTPAFDRLIFIKQISLFLVMQKQKLYSWEPDQNHKQALPLSTKDILLFHNGLVYSDLLNQLYLRQSPFSDFEISLIKLYHQIQDNLASLENTSLRLPIKASSKRQLLRNKYL